MFRAKIKAPLFRLYEAMRWILDRGLSAEDEKGTKIIRDSRESVNYDKKHTDGEGVTESQPVGLAITAYIGSFSWSWMVVPLSLAYGSQLASHSAFSIHHNYGAKEYSNLMAKVVANDSLIHFCQLPFPSQTLPWLYLSKTCLRGSALGTHAGTNYETLSKSCQYNNCSIFLSSSNIFLFIIYSLLVDRDILSHYAMSYPAQCRWIFFKGCNYTSTQNVDKNASHGGWPPPPVPLQCPVAVEV